MDCKKKIMLVVLSVLLLVMGMLNTPVGLFFSVLAILAICYILFFSSRSEEEEQEEEEKIVGQQEPFIAAEGSEACNISLHKLTRDYRTEQRTALNQFLSDELIRSLKVLKKAVPCHTAAVFFIGKSDSVYLRAWISEDEDKIVPGAVIQAGMGLIGQMVRNQGGSKIENDFVNNSQTLFYYRDHAGVRSFMAASIIIDNVFRGIVVLDHQEPGRFTKEDQMALENFSRLAGQLSYQSFQQLEHRIDRERITALQNMERGFLDMVSVGEIVKGLADITREALSFDRLMISLKGKGENAKVVWSEGIDSGFFNGFEFQYHEKGLVNITLSKNVPIAREFESGQYTKRFSEREKENKLLRVILVEPIGSKTECIGAISLEKRELQLYSVIEQEMLRNLTTAASVALEKAKTLEAVQTLATRDGLTGLDNHREFQNILGLKIRAAKRTNDALALIMTDIDYFKKVNDTYGHPAGDVVLKEISKILQSNIRQGIDSVARYGGEEFAIVIDKADEAMMLETAERIRSVVEQMAIHIGSGKMLKVTISMGCALYPRDARNQKEFIEKADNALYRAKESGRNRVIRSE